MLALQKRYKVKLSFVALKRKPMLAVPISPLIERGKGGREEKEFRDKAKIKVENVMMAVLII